MAIKPDKKGKVTGTKKADKITWLNQKEWKKALTVNAGSGNDFIDFRKSKYKNTLNGGAGNDKIYGGSNSDTIDGGTGNDTIHGYNGNDILKGGSGNDVLYGDAGNDKIYGGKGNDKLYGGAGKNNLYFYKGDGKDTVYSTSGGSDTLLFTDTEFKKIIFKQSGDNLIISGYGNDSDSVTVSNYFKGNSSVKTIKTKDRTLSIANAMLQSNAIHRNDPTGKFIIGTIGDDLLYGTDKNDVIIGNNGSDTIYGQGGDDTIEAFINSFVDGGDGDDKIKVEYGFSKIYGGRGNDKIYAEGSYNDIYAGNGNDEIHACSLNYIEAGDGDDKIQITGDGFISGNNVVYGGRGNDEIKVYGDNNTVYGGCGEHHSAYGINGDNGTPSGDDTIEVSGSFNYVDAEDGNNHLFVGNGTQNQIYLKDGNNSIYLSGGSSNLIAAGNGDNNVICMAKFSQVTDGVLTLNENNTIWLGSGNNTINTMANTGSTFVIANGGNDELNLLIETQKMFANLGDGNNTVNISNNNICENTINTGSGDDTYNIHLAPLDGSDLAQYLSQNTIYDSSGNDTINFENINDTHENLKMYLNVSAHEGEINGIEDITFDSNLVIYNDLYNNTLNPEDVLFVSESNSITIENYLDDGKIENINSYDDYHIDENTLRTAAYTVANWLSNHEGYDCVQDVIDGGNAGDINAVISQFSTAWVQNAG